MDHPKEGEVIYADSKEVLCRRWNWRECDKSKMTEQTRNVALVVEGLFPVSEKDVRAIAEEPGQVIEKCCGGKISTHILHAGHPEIEI